MENAAAPIYSLPALARLSGMTCARLRAIIAAEDIALLGWAWTPGRHPRGSLLDAIRLAVAAPLLARRFTATEAAYVLGSTLDEPFTGLTGCGVEIPRAVVLDRLHGRTIRVRFDLRGRLAEAGWLLPGAPAEPSDMTLTLNPLRLAQTVYARIDAHKSTDAKKLPVLRAAGGSVGGRPIHFIAGPPALAEKGIQP